MKEITFSYNRQNRQMFIRQSAAHLNVGNRYVYELITVYCINYHRVRVIHWGTC